MIILYPINFVVRKTLSLRNNLDDITCFHTPFLPSNAHDNFPLASLLTNYDLN